MARINAAADGNPNRLEEDVLYVGVLLYAKFAKSKKPEYPDQIEVEWELRQGGKQRDWLGISVGMNKTTGQPSKLRQALNALAEKPKDADLWFDAETLEWGYDLDGEDDTPAYAKLTPGMVVNFKGELREERYKVTGYRAPSNGKAAAKRKPKPEPSEPVGVDPEEIPF